MSTPANKLFDRLALQAKMRKIIQTHGTEGWTIIASAIEREIKHDEYQKLQQAYHNLEHSDPV